MLTQLANLFSIIFQKIWVNNQQITEKEKLIKCLFLGALLPLMIMWQLSFSESYWKLWMFLILIFLV